MDVNIIAKPKANGVVVLTLQGDIGNDTVESFKAKIDELIKNPVKKYVMDFAEVSYVNSIGVGAVAAALKKAKKIQGNIKFINVSSTVMELFELTRLTKVFEIYESEDEALRSYETAPAQDK